MNDPFNFLLKSGTSKNFEKKEFLIKQGEKSNKVFFIKEGVTRHYVITPDGHEKTIRISKEHDFFYSSIISYFKNESSYIFCQCLTDCKLVIWNRNHIEDLFSQFPEIASFKNQQLINFILEKHEKEISLLTQNAEDRYLEFCDKNLELFNRIPHHIIASYLDITPETLSRLRSKKY
ncbi:Crp/Fnr family transcriptional regulator [Seonamhaeicola aphaedonensis]|uniref:CRP-like cAMP-binding protein n=1 Tax=Seonamhaeicola aphaedonensis TaxID=1461338 RepID=A0A3D9HIX3_9FLAO|nr:Crp/Fnr family transcriptional regulator [Seonamhaeicola aphaedonensis]RED49459.1 CRP-like cAMP-binding protein [Seonamhaeicola aphaedonensis]